MLENRSKSRRSRSLRAGARFWVRPECRKIACGMMVAPTMPTAIVNAPASGSRGTTLPSPAAAQSTGAMTHLDEIAKGDRRYERADDEFDRAKAAAFEHQKAVGEDGGYAHADEERDMQEQRETDGAAEEFGEVGRHRRHFAHDP